jgi:hypothetical protein
MERNRYLQLCQQNAVYPNSVELEVDGIKYIPDNLIIWFDNQGKVQNTAKLIEVKSLSVRYEKVDKVNEVLK